MGVKTKDKAKYSIWVGDMEEGQIAEIIAWGTQNSELIGKIIIVNGANIYKVGENGYWRERQNLEKNNRVRILQPGELLEII